MPEFAPPSRPQATTTERPSSEASSLAGSIATEVANIATTSFPTGSSGLRAEGAREYRQPVTPLAEVARERFTSLPAPAIDAVYGVDFSTALTSKADKLLKQIRTDAGLDATPPTNDPAQLRMALTKNGISLLSIQDEYVRLLINSDDPRGQTKAVCLTGLLLDASTRELKPYSAERQAELGGRAITINRLNESLDSLFPKVAYYGATSQLISKIAGTWEPEPREGRLTNFLESKLELERHGPGR